MHSDVQKALEHCLIRDRYPLSNALRKAEALEGESRTAALADLLQRIEKSQKLAAARAQTPELHYPESLPVSERRADILRLIREHQVVVVAGETGSGKTTQLPKFCLEAGLGIYGRIGHTQPRRLAARSVSQRIADELRVPLGGLVGYQVRFTDQSDEQTRIKVMTDGILLAQTQKDRFLNEYDCLIIDEAHERSLNIDFLLGYLKQLLPKRPDLKLVITSATIDVERFSKHFDNAPVVEVSGRTFPVEVRYRPLIRESEDDEDRSVFEGINDALAELRDEDKQKGSPGDVLVFLPGEREIRECADYLRRQSLPATEITQACVQVSAGDQQKIFHPTGGRRIVLSTNVAETSLTVPGIRYVVDSGVARISRYSYRSKVQRLPVEAISQASANQRAGRCGRVEPGICIRLYEEQDFAGRSEFTDPEIQRTNLASVILQMMNLKLGDIRNFPFVDAPDDRFVKDGYTLLQELQAVDDKRRLTQLGRSMGRLPVDPRMARMLLAAGEHNCITEMMIIAAALSVPDPRERPPEKQQQAAEKHRLWADEKSDFVAFINLWNAHEEQRQELTQNQLRKWCQKHFLSYMRMREWRDTHRQLHLLCRELGLKESGATADYDAVHKALLSGMLSQIGFHSEQKEYRGARGRQFVLTPGSSVYKKPPKWVMAAELVETSRLYARTVAAIEPEWIEACGHELLKYQYFEPHWHIKRGQVVAYEQSSLYGLIVNPRKPVNYADKHPEAAWEVMIIEGLVAQNMRTRADFVQANADLLKDVTEYEEKSRRRDLVIDDQALIDFYKARIPQHISSTRSLESWLRKAPEAERKALYFTRDFLLSDAAQGISSQAYPPEMSVAGIGFPVTYAFAPGASDDGVTLTVPVAMLPQINEKQTEWLVPGFLHNKVVALLKGLPKPIRKQFVPVPDTASDFIAQSSPQDGGLLTQLAAYLNRTLRPKIESDVLAAIELEPHLRMNYRVVDGEGEVLDQGRDLQALQDEFRDQGKAAVLTVSDTRYQKAGIQDWDFGDLPDSTESDAGGLSVRSYPCLKVSRNPETREQSISLTVESDPQRAMDLHRSGLLSLLRQRLSAQERAVRAQIQNAMKPNWLYAKGLGTEAELTEELVKAAFMHQLLPLDQPLPRTQSAFNACIEQRGGVCELADKLIAMFIDWLKIRHAVLKAMRGAVSLDKAMAYSDVQANLERLLAPGFMVVTPWQYLSCFTRYLRAMEYRIDKLQGNLPRDRQSMIEFESLYKPWHAAMKDATPEQRPDLEEFGWLLEEWRVSLFAQPLGTRVPVSLKRLEKRWSEIRH